MLFFFSTYPEGLMYENHVKSRKVRRTDPEIRAREIAKMEEKLVQLVPTGLKLIPEEFRAITCPKPSDEVINSIKERNREKRKISTKQKQLLKANESSDKTSKKT